jgi:hypothetical protein
VSYYTQLLATYRGNSAFFYLFTSSPKGHKAEVSSRITVGHLLAPVLNTYVQKRRQEKLVKNDALLQFC